MRVLIVGPSWVGDMVMAQSLFKVLGRAQPDARIEVLAPPWSRPLLERMPEVVRSIEMPVGHGRLQPRERYRIGKRLRGRYEQAILLPNSFKSALIPYWAKIPRRTGYLGEMRHGLLNDIRPLNPDLSRSTARRFAALGNGNRDSEPLPAPRLRVDLAQARQTARALGLERGAAGVLAVCPGAEYGPAKRWPAEHYATLVGEARHKGWRVWLMGSDNDTGVGRSVARAAADSCVDLTGKTRLSEAIDLLSLADAVVSNDSGLMHIAAALERPLVALFGSSDPALTGPAGAHVRLLYRGLECSPCFARNCPLGHLRCLRELTPARVWAELEAVLGR